MSRPDGAFALAGLLAVASGAVLAWVDSRPGFDATGLTVVALVGAACVAVLVSRTRRVAVALLLGLLVGVWIPLLEIGGSAGAASLAAILFAVVGALTALGLTRALGTAPAR